MINLSRRQFCGGLAAAGAMTALPGIGKADQVIMPLKQGLIPAPETLSFFESAEAVSTPVWAFGGAVPGPEIRLKQGERVQIPLTNKLPQDTTVHWHGLRIPVNMDGVPYLSQEPVKPGETFLYEFVAPDAGTFWYHPHVNSVEQVGRGLSGAFIVEEHDPPEVDRDVTWLLDDWRLQETGEIYPFGGNLHDAAHAGRIGNLPTVNGQSRPTFEVRPGERIRLRLINAANARIFGLSIPSATTWLMAIDGHPLTPREVTGQVLPLAPGSRVDLILDMKGMEGQSFELRDLYYNRFAYTLVDLSYAGAAVRQETLGQPEKLPENPVNRPDWSNAERHEFVLEGGARGGLREAELNGKMTDLRTLADMGMVWAVNGKMIPHMTAENPGEPMLTLEYGKSHIIRIRNRTAWEHPIHLHGLVFEVQSSKGGEGVLLDTVLVRPDEEVDIAFVADNPGDWAMHCHVLEHARAGMMGYVRVG